MDTGQTQSWCYRRCIGSRRVGQPNLDRIKSLGAESVEEVLGREENMFFEVPKELQITQV